MSLFDSHSTCLDRETNLLRRIRDLEQDIRDLQKAFSDEREKLVDKILAMANPAAVREYRRIPLENMNILVDRAKSETEALQKLRGTPQRMNWPGYRVDDRPNTRPDMDKSVPVAAAKPAYPNITDPAAYRLAVAAEKGVGSSGEVADG